MIENYKKCLDEATIIKLNNFLDFCKKPPKIADNIIKQIQIDECDEELVDVKTKEHPRIKLMDDPQHLFASPNCNSGLPSASKIRKGVFLKLEQLVIELDKLSPNFGYKDRQFEIHLFEGLRDIQTQEKLFYQKLEELRLTYQKDNIQKTEAELLEETSTWISPVVNNIPVHSTGAAVDIRLYDKLSEQYLDMGKFGAIWGENNTAPTFSDNITTYQKVNRLLLIFAALRSDLNNYPNEWWHFSYGDRYAGYMRGENTARYGMVVNLD